MTGGELDVAGLRRVGASPGHWWVDRLIRTIEAVSVAGGTSKQAQDRIFLFRSNAAAIQLRPLFLSAKQKPRRAHERQERKKERKTPLVRSLLSRQRAWRFVSDISYQISSGRSRSTHTRRHIACETLFYAIVKRSEHYAIRATQGKRK